MNAKIHLNSPAPSRRLVALVLICLALVPLTQAVVPPPDGGYPGANTAEGQNALLNLAGGVHNTAVGYLSLKTDITGGYNTAVGSGTLFANTADANTATGFAALYKNTTGFLNTANGAGALFNNTEGFFNTASGAGALFNNISGADNTANGYQALYSNTGGGSNTANGASALYFNTTGGGNTANGEGALYHNTTGDENTANGGRALYHNRTGNGNTANGAGALFNNIIGSENTASGDLALYFNTGSANTADGNQALRFNTTGSENTASGTLALFNNTAGNRNTAFGFRAGLGVTTANNVISIGADVSGENVSNSCFIGNIFSQLSFQGTGVFINSAGKLGTITSSRRFKEGITPMGKASEVILALRPVTFRYKKDIDPQSAQQFGLVAEEVEKVNPDLVVRDVDGRVNTVRYEQINAMLLNEFLKEHRKNEKQQAIIERQQKQIEALTAGLQRVSAQFDLNKPTPQTVAER